MPWGITDLFAIHVDLDRVIERKNLGHCNSSRSDQEIMVLLSIPTAESGKMTNRSALNREFSYLIGESKLDVILRALFRRKFIVISEDDEIARNTPWLPYHIKMWSVELKLERVDEALAQAKRHLKVTPFSYVGLPEKIAEKVFSTSKSLEFEEAGVGLLSVSKESCAPLMEPKGDHSCVDDIFAVAAAERCWSAILKAIQH